MRGRKLGWCGYATIYSILLDTPMTAMGVAEKMGVRTQSASRVLERMRALGFAHWCEYVNPKPHCKSVALYSAGEGPEPPTPGHLKGRSHTRGNALPEVIAAMGLLKALRSPISLDDLSMECGASHTNVRRFLRHCKDLRLIHVVGWDNTRPGKPTALYCIGIGPDVPKPQPKSRSQINREHRTGRIAKLHQLTVFRALAMREAA